MRLVIVDRNRPDVYQRMTDRFASDPKVRVMFDRRSRVTELPSDRRRDEDESKANLWDEGYIVVVTPE